MIYCDFEETIIYTFCKVMWINVIPDHIRDGELVTSAYSSKVMRISYGFKLLPCFSKMSQFDFYKYSIVSSFEKEEFNYIVSY